LRVQDIDFESIQHPKAYLSQIATRLCLDTLKSARNQREVYIGPWLPEPLITKNQRIIEPEKTIETMDSVSMAFMLLIEALSPAERAVFILREVFDYDYSTIAQILEKDESACRQLFSRAKKHLVDNRPRYQQDEQQHDALLNTFLQACQTGNIQELESILASEVLVTVDGGGEVTAATRPIYGRERAVRFLQGIFGRGLNQATFKSVIVTKQNGLLDYKGNKPIILFMIANDKTAIQQVWAIRNPKKLAMLEN
jgi:RNA polymerase sigma-70 factor (ECF subfamily)